MNRNNARDLIREEAAKSTDPEIAEHYRDRLQAEHEDDALLDAVQQRRGRRPLGGWDDDQRRSDSHD